MLKFTKRRGFVLLGVIAALVVAGAAIAYWTAGGSGNGTADTATPSGQLTVNQTGSLTAMYPGDSEQTLSGTFDNPTGANVHVDTPVGPTDATALHRDQVEAAALVEAQADRAREARRTVAASAAVQTQPNPPSPDGSSNSAASPADDSSDR